MAHSNPTTPTPSTGSSSAPQPAPSSPTPTHQPPAGSTPLQRMLWTPTQGQDLTKSIFPWAPTTPTPKP